MSQRLFCPHTEDSACNANRQGKLNKEINKIYAQRLHDRLLPHADMTFYRNKKELTKKKFKLKKKENCVKDANMVIATYEGLINRRGLIRANHRYTSISDADTMDKPTQP